MDYIRTKDLRRFDMKLSEAIKPISYLKAHASEIIRKISENRQTVVITQNGEAKAVLQDIHLYDETRESLAMLKILAQSSESLRLGNASPRKEAFKRLRKRIEEYNES